MVLCSHINGIQSEVLRAICRWGSLKKLCYMAGLNLKNSISWETMMIWSRYSRKFCLPLWLCLLMSILLIGASALRCVGHCKKGYKVFSITIRKQKADKVSPSPSLLWEGKKLSCFLCLLRIIQLIVCVLPSIPTKSSLPCFVLSSTSSFHHQKLNSYSFHNMH